MFESAKGENTIGKEREDDWDLEFGVCAFLETIYAIEGFSKSGWVEGGILK